MSLLYTLNSVFFCVLDNEDVYIQFGFLCVFLLKMYLKQELHQAKQISITVIGPNVLNLHLNANQMQMMFLQMRVCFISNAPSLNNQ